MPFLPSPEGVLRALTAASEMPAVSGPLAAPSSQLYYSVNLGTGHFVMLNSEGDGEGGGLDQEQLSWLEKDLAGCASVCELL